MFSRMLAFEWRYFIRQPSFYVTCLVFFLLPYLALVIDNVRIGSGGNVLYNSPYAIAQITLILGIFSMFLVVNFVANTAIRNQQSKMLEIVYTKPINPVPYQLGRFFGAYLVCVTVFAMVPLGIFIGSLMPWVDSERIGPNHWHYYLTPFLIFSVSTLFVLASVFYAVAQKFRSMMAVYLAALGLFIVYVISGELLSEPDQRAMAALFDPFGLRTFTDVTRYWTAHERNTEVVGLTTQVIQNRGLWLGFGALVLLAFGGLFKPMALQLQKSKAGKKAKKDPQPLPLGNNIHISSQPGGTLSKLLSRSVFEAKQVIFSPSFAILLLFSAFSLISQFFDPRGMYGAPNWPLTQTMVDMISGAFGLMMIIVITYYSAEVVWRERTTGIGDIIDSTPVSNFTLWLSKLLSVALVILSIQLIGMLATIANQLISGYSYLDISQYLISLVYFSALPFFLLAILAFFIQALSPNKYVGMLIFVGYFFASLVFNQIGLEHNMLNYGAAPVMRYSDLNGYGWFIQTQNWYMLYWSSLAIILGVISYGAWQRGPQMRLSAKLKLLKYNAGSKGLIVACLAAVLFVATGAYIHHNTRVLNEFVTQDQGRDWQEQYERSYKAFEDSPVPTIVDVDVAVDMYPAERRIEATAEFTMTNMTSGPISRVLVNYPQYSPVAELTMDNAQLTEKDDYLRTAWLEFDQPLQSGESRNGQFKVVRQHLGFKDGNEDYTMVANGTFINNFDLFPTMGYNTSVILADRHERRKRGLEPLQRAYPLEDSSRYGESFFGKGVGLIDFAATLSTSAGQFAIAPGYLQKHWQENGREYYRYEMDSPMIHFYSLMSAQLAVEKQQYKGIDIEVYYHPQHSWNVQRMIESVQDSIDYFSAAFGPYQHKQMRIIEFPGYRSFAQSFANTVPYSEQIGFISDLRDPEDIDPVYYVTAHEVAHQWWGHQVNAANVQGSAIISESLSQYSALMVMEQKYGKDKIRKFLTYELDRYLRGRTSELLAEMPLMRSEGQSYIHYRKGSVVMMAIKDRLGEEAMNQALYEFADDYRYATERYPTTLDLMAALTANATSEQQAFIEDQFKQVTLYDLRATEISHEEIADQRHQITFTINAQQFSADGKGQETEQQFDDYVDVVLFSDDPNDFASDNKIIYQQKHRIVSGENRLVVEVDELPGYAGIDPFVRFIDRDSGNNIIRL